MPNVLQSHDLSQPFTPATNRLPTALPENSVGDLSGGKLSGCEQPSIERSSLERFFDSFFKEENIKWLTVIGATIVLGSSLMLVTREWQSFQPAVKFLIILAYTTVIYVCAEAARHRFGLQTTANVLYLLTLLLIPLCFMALRWLQSGDAGVLAALPTVGLMIPAVAFMIFSASRILEHLLRGRQTTFTISYMLLSVAGTLPVFPNWIVASAFAVTLWTIMSVGVLKINRYLFWMVEEHKQPRAFAFFPIALLGCLFLTLVSTKAMRAIPLEWLGLGCVMVSATILMTARTVAEVFRRRTGNLVHPLPWNLVVPLLVGLMMLIFGVVVAFHGFSFAGSTTYAAVPTALIAGGLLIIVAWDTGVSGFVWGALLLLTIAYQSSPTLVSGLIAQLKQHAASAVNESSLPVAFYGITYLPWIAILILLSRGCSLPHRAGGDRWKCFARPIQHFATLLTLALFLLATFHLKAFALVSIIDVPLLLCMAIGFRDRRFAYASLACLVLASILLVPLGNAMDWWQLSNWFALTPVAILALVLVTSPGIDRCLLRIPLPTTPLGIRGELHAENAHCERPSAVCLIVGRVLALCVALGWCLSIVDDGLHLTVRASVPMLLLMATFFAVTLRTKNYLSAASFWTVIGIGMMLCMLESHLPWRTLLIVATAVAVCVSLSGYWTIYWLNRRGSLSPGNQSIAQPFVSSLSDLCTFVASILAAVYYLPAIILAHGDWHGLAMPGSASLMMLWGVGMAVTNKSRIYASLSAIVLPLWLSAVLVSYWPGTFSIAAQTIIWSLAAASMLLFARWRPQHLSFCVSVVAQAWLIGLTCFSLLNADLEFRVVGLVSLAIGGYLHGREPVGVRKTIIAIVASIQLWLLVIGLCGVDGWFFQWLESHDWTAALACQLPLIGLGLLVFDTYRLPLDRVLCTGWTACLRSIAVAQIAMLFASGLTFQPWLPIILLGLFLIAVAEVVQAIRLQVEAQVWLGFGILGIGLLWLGQVGAIEFGTGLGQALLVSASVLGLLSSWRLADKGRYAILARPMRAIGLIGPALLTALATSRAVGHGTVRFDALDTLSMFAAAAIYFQYGLTQKKSYFFLFALAIVNVALMLTWRGLHLVDPQFYCVPVGLSVIGIVELLKRELPQAAHDPLRYLGALILLVSPVFDIVGGSWLHLLSLMIMCVFIILIAIGMRLRSLIYTGTAFLMADLVMMVVRSSIDNPSLLWISGLGLGAAVIVLGAICERHREQVLSRIRQLSAELATWH